MNDREYSLKGLSGGTIGRRCGFLGVFLLFGEAAADLGRGHRSLRAEPVSFLAVVGGQENSLYSAGDHGYGAGLRDLDRVAGASGGDPV